MTIAPATKEGRLPQSGYLPTLDGWRAVAIAAVMTSHALLNPLRGFGGRVEQLRGSTGMAGVDLFFGISGFLICSRLLEENALTGTISLRSFYIRRLLRILPAAWAYLIVVAGLMSVGFISISWPTVCSAGLFFRNYLPPEADWYTGHFWSLAVEEHFYLLWPILLLLARPRRALPVALFMCVLVAIWRGADAHFKFVSVTGVPEQMRTDYRLDALFAGCAVSIATQSLKVRAELRRLPGLTTALLSFVVVLVHLAKPPLFRLVESFLFPTIVAGTTFGASNMLFAVLESKPFRFIGRLSYSLYLWQQFFLLPYGVEPHNALLQRVPLNLLSAVACAYVSYRFIEKPFVRLGHRLAPPITPGR